MEVGIRVVRGPDWKWQDQDGGDGHTGTVVEIGRAGNSCTPDRTVVVQWDCGFRTNYRVGYQGAFDLRVLDNAPTGVKHPNIMCDGCKKQGLLGIRWKCSRCFDFDLCHQCYMGNKHDLSHTFLRFDSPNACNGLRLSPSSVYVSVKVGKRSNSTTIQARGIFPGAKVVRGPDWDWGNQDGGEMQPGRVEDIRGWDAESGSSVANVHWLSSGTTNVYRLGHKGKVDLKYTQEGVGPCYYRDHLMVLGEKKEASQAESVRCKFKVGNKVKVCFDEARLRAMQEGHGGWNPRMAEYVGKVGCVHRITDRGDVRVQYEGCSNRWTFNAESLTKVQLFSAGDYVRVSSDVQRVRELQRGHGDWTDSMINALGKTGTVVKVFDEGDLRVVVGSEQWTFNSALCTPLPHEQTDANNTLTRQDRARDRDRSQHQAPVLGELLETEREVQSLQPAVDPERLVREAAQGHLEQVQEIIKSCPDKVDTRSSGKTALQVASHQGHTDIVRLLLAANANLELQDEDGDTALHYSAFGDQPEVMDMLQGKGAKVNLVNKGGCSSLHVAVNKQHSRCVQSLLRHNADVNIQDKYGDTALHDGIGKDSVAIVEMLINHPGTDFLLKNRRGFNVLHHTALKGNDHATEKIVHKCRQAVDSKKDDGFAALHLAALNGHIHVAHTLISLGRADLEVRNNRRQTPLLLAVSQGHVTMVELLVNSGASVAAEDDDGNTCLHLALMRQSLPSELDNTSAVAQLHTKLAASHPDLSLVVSLACFLIDKKASPDQRNVQGKTPIDVLNDPKTATFLRKYILRGHAGPRTLSVRECRVCDDPVADITFQPCGHNVVCSDCCVRMKKCLECQTPILRKLTADGHEVSSGRSRSTEHSKVTALLRQVEAMEERMICSICMDAPFKVVFGCGHHACENCTPSLRECHMCRKPITTTTKIF